VILQGKTEVLKKKKPHFVLQKSHMEWPEGFVVDGVILG